MLLKLGALLVSQEKSYMSTADEVPERFPVKIAFTRKLDEQELTKLAIYALIVENGVAAEGGRMKCCENCACYEEEWEYCFRNGNHAPKEGYCDYYREELPKEVQNGD